MAKEDSRGKIESAISGESVDIIAGTAVKTGTLLVATGASGGNAFAAKVCKSATVKSLSGDVWVGGTAVGDMPYSGYGFLLAAGEAVSLDIDNFSDIKGCANISGDWLAIIGVV